MLCKSRLARLLFRTKSHRLNASSALLRHSVESRCSIRYLCSNGRPAQRLEGLRALQGVCRVMLWCHHTPRYINHPPHNPTTPQPHNPCTAGCDPCAWQVACCSRQWRLVLRCQLHQTYPTPHAHRLRRPCMASGASRWTVMPGALAARGEWGMTLTTSPSPARRCSTTATRCEQCVGRGARCRQAENVCGGGAGSQRASGSTR